ncbi:unnamed protein product [Schistosoma turkestanicum]|nr:unnamed protein product [Schistosoma turkestanicum]
MKKYSFLRIIQLFTSYQIFCLLYICAHGFNRCSTIVNNDGLPIVICDHERRLKTQSNMESYDDEQNELMPESDYTNEPVRLQQLADYLVPTKKAFVRLGKRGFVRIGKRGFVRIGR